ncbi:helix-turn-helix domain-containing protein [Alkaliphilus sp. B6464]|uniref:helix-turn-helix domain-containing protein n=1 Tax=Alkaliphilus sp. B6464 TaxID=2731219 RepID=UPI001BA58D5D|nr:helix-turn-helix transcriptional regulator [Alkaliphilus sp. B6464]QUH20215.1 helix-turn-helix transcriptional regulator [Alkaliphilus sp. B6464]
MVKIKLEEVLKTNDKTMYWLSKETNIAYNNLSNLTKGKNKSISFDVLEKICIALDCTPNDIIDIKN